MPGKLEETEDQFKDAVIEMAHVRGWMVAHFRAAQTGRGWRTPVQADGAGWPDLVLVRGQDIMVIELKSETGRLSPQQDTWLIRLQSVRRFRAEVWRPRHWPLIENVLKAGLGTHDALDPRPGDVVT